MHKEPSKQSKLNLEERLQEREQYLVKYFKEKHHKKSKLSYLFSIFAKKISEVVGNAWAFIIALSIIIIWGITGPYFKFSDTWQLIVNTGTTIITFLIVFLIQNTQNRDTEIINLKIDELIRATGAAENTIIDLTDLSDEELKDLEKEYKRLKNQRTGK